jgi:hypothetical protein
LKGYVHRAEVRSGIDGAIVASFDASQVAITGTKTPTTTVQSGRTWTINGTAWSWINQPAPLTWTVNGSNWWWGTYTGTQRYANVLVLDPQYVRFVRSGSTYASTPDSAALSITGDLDVRVKMAMAWQTLGIGFQGVISKDDNAPNSGWWLRRDQNTPRLNVGFSVTGADGYSKQALSTADIPFRDNEVGWIRFTLDADNGGGNADVRFYTSTDGVTWTQLGAIVQIAGAFTNFDNTAPVKIASLHAGSHFLDGDVYYAEIRNGIGGTVVGRFSAFFQQASAVRTPSTWADGLGNTWTINGSAWSYGIYPTRTISTPDSAALGIVGDIDIRMKWTSLDPLTPETSYLIDNSDYGMFWTSSGGLQLYWLDPATGAQFKGGNVSFGLTTGETVWLRATLDVDNGSTQNVVTLYKSSDGVTWSQVQQVISAGITSIRNTAGLPMQLTASASAFGFTNGTIHYAEIRNGIGGTVVGSFDPNRVRVTDPNLPTTVPGEQTWTITGSGWRWEVREL